MRKYGRWIVLAVAIFGCLYIWHFSLADGERSALTSGRALELINGALARLGSEFQFSHHTVRKIGHFVGYFLLGALVAFTLWMFEFTHYPLIAVPLCMTVAVVDEGIQYFSPGRVAAFTDVLLDSAGAVCGILAFFATVMALIAIFGRNTKKIRK